MGKVIVISSVCGGSGKSSVSVGLATVFSELKQKVVLLDLSAGARCLDHCLNVDMKIVYDISDAFLGHIPLEETIVSTENGVDFLAAPAKPLEFDFRLLEIITKLSNLYDYVIVDTKSTFSYDTVKLFPNDSEFIVNVEIDVTSMKNIGFNISNIEDNAYDIKLLINKFSKKKLISSGLKIDEIIDICGVPIVGILPLSNKFDINTEKTFLNGKYAKALYRVASRLSGNCVVLPKIDNI